MATVTVHHTDGTSNSFVTYDEKVIARYQGYASTDPDIASVTVDRDA